MSGKRAGKSSSAVCIEHVQAIEEEEISARRKEFGLCDKKDEVVGLAFSGGGIRSATFNLGVLQRLAETDLLKHIDYLSTVSGGGYIGCWLVSWIRREQLKQKLHARTARQPTRQDSAAPTRTGESPEKSPAATAFEKVRCSLSVESAQGAPEEAKVVGSNDDIKASESPKITFLRQYSNYLSPHVSIFSADTWVVGAVWTRNTLLNLAMLVALLASVVLTVRALGLGLRTLLSGELASEESIFFLVISVLLLAPIITIIATNIRSSALISAAHASSGSSREELRNTEKTESEIVRYCVFPLLSAIAYSFWLTHDGDAFMKGSFISGVYKNWIALSFGFLVIQGAAVSADALKPRWRRAAFTLFYSVISAFVTAALLRGIAFIFDAFSGHPQQPWFVLTFGPPFVLLAFTLGIVVHIGLMGRDLPESCREWLGRLGAWLTIFQAAWIFVAGISIYGPWLLGLLWTWSTGAVATLSTGWVVTSVAGLLAGNSNKTGAKGKGPSDSRGQILEIAARVGPYVFMLGFLLLVSLGVHALLIHGLDQRPAEIATQQPATLKATQFDLRTQYDDIVSQSRGSALTNGGIRWLYDWYWWHLGATQFREAAPDRWPLSALAPLWLVVVFAGGMLSWTVDVNLFSLHNFYRNRLVRCYLGASRQRERTPNPFTGFDDADDTPLDKFCKGAGYYGPYPIVNATLNVTSGGKLQYQERQAESFVFTPHYSGFSADTTVNEMRLVDAPRTKLADYQETPTKRPAAYRPTSTAAGGRISLGMAMGISGAAVSPNMGYHSSTAVSFLLSIFNVRLGWWLGNSLKDSAFKKEGPAFGLRYSLMELWGLSNANSSFVNLSDGGHFDNMGIYELVRRQCRFIICCDAEQDEQLRFDGIATAIRKCRTDFAVDIDLPLQPLAKVHGFSNAHCVVGRINYRDSKSPGYLLYLKSSLTGDEAADVLNYHAEAPQFPHESTADQWFDESQFESYRRLGHHVAGKALSGLTLRSLTKEEFFEGLYQLWRPVSSTVDYNSGAHTDIYGSIFEVIQRERDFASLDKKPPSAANLDWGHGGGRVCNGLIQLMQRIFHELQLEDSTRRDHPSAKPWLAIFSDWVSCDSFQTTWAVTGKSYPAPFRTFYSQMEDQVKLRSKPSAKAAKA